MPEHADGWLTEGELAKLLGLDRSTIKRRLKSGRLPRPARIDERGWKWWSPRQIRQILHNEVYKGARIQDST